MQIKTMLAVRPTEEKSSQYAAGVSTGEMSTDTGRVVGWAVCVHLQDKTSYERSLSVDAKWDAGLKREEQCSMRLGMNHCTLSVASFDVKRKDLPPSRTVPFIEITDIRSDPDRKAEPRDLGTKTSGPVGLGDWA
ncbi:hypothetical protein F4813DRAFT_395272 [Daldinia decipiens]|uniref:uncharacterized protein n=1 Tax=Daldinia decipiens TaxID=326647 RepID=UPI0020C1E4E5|nr:uncharacterized protein F4813DRAFT_395272 [Daldinia decipiens]KAI1658849.1 hypothetical protein F4813DRAFT_395272 [Daldinia decipiens]